ncbi:MAG TPA: Gfo/Idh/MocA family oxidoreductase, partial [Lacipirellulaceae bacterium]|nr:Gfo/Idh/MocA family oxidoreductase [Lacipirellulaceae bacterium]
MPIGFGIVGAGMISRFHAKALAEVRGAKLVACADTAPGRAVDFAKEFGGAGYESLDAMLADKNVDVVTIATPSGAHMDPAVAAAKAGKHVI